jgi:hypothetical protein
LQPVEEASRQHHHRRRNQDRVEQIQSIPQGQGVGLGGNGLQLCLGRQTQRVGPAEGRAEDHDRRQRQQAVRDEQEGGCARQARARGRVA